MIVVSDASPLIALHAIGRLDLLEALYGEILVAGAVTLEYLGAHLPEAELQARRRSWLVERAIANEDTALALALHLGRGEAESIALSLALDADLLLMDERRGRQAAMRLTIRCLGTVGVLLHAKQRGLLSVLRSELDSLAERAGFWLSAGVRDAALRAAGE